MRRKYIIDPNKQELDEEQMHPSKILGYDHDIIGSHLFTKGAFDIAEKEFRRAVYLNPYELRFKMHLASSLYMLKKYQKAEELSLKILEIDPKNSEAHKILESLNEQQGQRT